MPYARPPSLWLRPAAVAAATATLLNVAGGGASWIFKKQTPGGASGVQSIIGWSGTGANPPGLYIRENGDLTGSGRLLSESGGTLGWEVVAGANAICATTCTNACVFGVDNAALTADIVGCYDASADECLCAGSS